MTEYFLVEEGQIVKGPVSRPTGGVSNMWLLTQEQLAVHGWFPQEVVGFEPFDPVTQERTGPVNTVEGGVVVSTYTISARPEMDVWVTRMEAHTMTRHTEEILATMSAEQFAAVPEYTRDLYAEKTALRAAKPE